MNRLITFLFVLLVLIACSDVKKQVANEDVLYNEQHRPQIHFTPEKMWMNDPNGMFFLNGTYHLFYQYYPDSTVWGPMHWGHATTKDLMHWEHQPIALYPDSLGYIFSGSVVVDSVNSSGLGKDGKVPLVAFFTHHNAKGEKEGRTDYQNQSIAYSLDEGKSWTKYEANPVIKNPGVKDFRDPKVTWHAESQRWIMSLAAQDRIVFYSSSNLVDWTKESEFGKEFGAHGGVWECPDLFSLDYNGEKVWILFVSINPGGPNGGSATQYFTGTFDGKTFTPFQTDTRWIDYGPDNYAGVTWFNTGYRKIFLGWMGNWQYATLVPTGKWRSAMTMPRDLDLEKIGDKYFIRSTPSPEIKALETEPSSLNNLEASNIDLTPRIGKLNGPSQLKITSDELKTFSITLSNSKGQKVVVGYDRVTNNYYIDRTNSGNTSFEKGFGKKHTAPRLSNSRNVDITLVIDNASVELFADNGLSVMTAIFFPDEIFSNLAINSSEGFFVKDLAFAGLKSIYEGKPVAVN